MIKLQAAAGWTFLGAGEKSSAVHRPLLSREGEWFALPCPPGALLMISGGFLPSSAKNRKKTSGGEARIPDWNELKLEHPSPSPAVACWPSDVEEPLPPCRASFPHLSNKGNGLHQGMANSFISRYHCQLRGSVFLKISGVLFLERL